MSEINVIIKNARDVLVGKIPDPKAQVEQITIALMYKFMDAKDFESVEYGGEPSFFVGDYAEYSFKKILEAPKNTEKLRLYRVGLEKMQENPNLPELFRAVFKGTYLPYNDAAILALFLKEINQISTENTEIIGTAFEDLLSIMGSQGDAGQFRTPRHIIDFIVQVIEPKKHETILDPACGTAGFLVSAYNHIFNDNKDKIPGDMLSALEKSKLMSGIQGYDISPDMVRLADVNLFLHGFQKPNITEFDTLTDKENWKNKYDIILANPPFMTPKGGIKPHELFLVKAKRSEVLFVDYIMEHLTKNGRAGVIVPEGIVFKSSDKAYKKLREYLVNENILYAVISLPAGVFNPYSGVKTNILLLDKNLAKQTKKILFVKIDNDGFDLGAQRNATNNNDIPRAIQILKNYKIATLAGKTYEIDDDSREYANLVEKNIIRDKEYVLVSERYTENKLHKNIKWDLVELGNICNFVRGPFGGSLKKEIFVQKGFLIYEQYHAINNDFSFGRYYIDEEKFNQMKRFEVMTDDLLISCSGTMGKIAIVPQCHVKGIINQALLKLTVKPCALVEYIKYVLESSYIQNKYFKNQTGSAIQNVTSVKVLKTIKIPLPPLSIQERIVTEIKIKQREIKELQCKIEKLNSERNKKIEEVWGD